jgi:hypothetical protein
MQIQAWFYKTPGGTAYGPSFTSWQAMMAAVRHVTKRRKLDDETAMLIWRSIARAGWTVYHTPMKLCPAPDPPLSGDIHGSGTREELEK